MHAQCIDHVIYLVVVFQLYCSIHQWSMNGLNSHLGALESKLHKTSGMPNLHSQYTQSILKGAQPLLHALCGCPALCYLMYQNIRML